MAWRGAGIGSYRYGSSVLWTLHGDLVGTGAGRFAGRVDLFFRSGEPELVVDLGGAGIVDSAGAAALARLRADHPGLLLIGRPAALDEFPLPVRRLLGRITSATDLVSALVPRSLTGPFPERRHDPRIPLQLPVELFFRGGRTTASLKDISRGGVRLDAPGLGDGALRDGELFEVLGLEEDPLGRAFVHDAAASLRAASVRGAAIGARFADSPPPV